MLMVKSRLFLIFVASLPISQKSFFSVIAAVLSIFTDLWTYVAIYELEIFIKIML